ncbi:hypothetical protein FQN52_008260 [Onygenales sp. PD_12]|nr:hypothetical protein FQN52_008260 [Onygenales sp. PD_12]KAK2807453.1 hypothetical protein FQN51_003280 [Onygenales sp. PD_10]
MDSDTPMSDASPPPSAGPANHNGDGDVEFLATSRARRSTAGKNMATLIDAEADDELALLFAEEEDDEEFDSAEGEPGQADEGVDEADDMQLDSSSDEEDQGPNAQEDELEGERELERQAKAERLAKKRKEQEGLRFTTLRKRVKIDPTAASSSSPRTPTIPTAPRPKKKSERISWLPTPEEGPTRSSSRRQTMQNKELTHARLKDSEEKRVRLIATMEEAARRKEKLKPKQMTQADRLAEAARTERLNAKSLNRWEEMERRRAEEQKARLEALQNRRLEGAVVSWWSGFAKWVNGRLARVGNKEIAIDEGEGRKRKGADGEEKKGKARKGEKGNDKEKAVDWGDKVADAEKAKAGGADEQGLTQSGEKDGSQQITFAPPQVPGSFLDGIHIYASMKDDIHGGSTASRVQDSGAARTTMNTSTVPTPASQTPASKASAESAVPPQSSTSQAPPAEATPKPAEATQSSAPPPPQPSKQPIQRIEVQIPFLAQKQPPPQQESQPQQKPDQPQPQPTPTNTNANDPTPPSNPQTKHPTTPAVPPPHHPPTSLPAPAPTLTPAAPAPAATPAPPPVIETTSRNLIILSNFENKTPAEREEFNIFFNPRKPQKLQKTPTPLCPITSRPARHRDPETQLVYANALAYKEIRQALASRYAWSGVLGCFVGPVGVGARGVPERFLAPNEVPRVGPVGGGGGEE